MTYSFSNFKGLMAEGNLSESETFTPGRCKFKVISFEDAISQAGNPKRMLTLLVEDVHGIKRKIMTNLVLSPKALFIIKGFCEAIGKPELFAKGSLPTQEIINTTGEADIKTETYLKPGEQEMRERLVVSKYIPKVEKEIPKAHQEVEELDDDISF